MKEKIEKLILNFAKIQEKEQKIGVTVKRNILAFYSTRYNNFPFKKNVSITLVIDREKIMFKSYDFSNYSNNANYISASEFIDYLISLI